MKQKDIPLFIIIAIMSAVLSVLASNFLITPSKIKRQQAEVIEAISPKFNTPKADDKYLNANSINPTKTIKIGDTKNDDPFKDVDNN